MEGQGETGTIDSVMASTRRTCETLMGLDGGYGWSRKRVPDSQLGAMGVAGVSGVMYLTASRRSAGPPSGQAAPHLLGRVTRAA